MPRFRSSSMMMSFPRFTGVTSQLVIANVAIYFLLLLMQHAAPQAALLIFGYCSLTPALLVRGWVWQVVTYSFLHSGVLHVALNMLTLWFIGAYLESSKGSRWLLETYFFSAIGGALIASALSFTHLLHSDPRSSAMGSDAAVFGLLASFAVLFGDLEMFMFPLPISIKARYLVIAYMLIFVAMLLAGGPALSYFTILGGALTGYLYSKRAPRRGVSTTLGQRWFEMRNQYYRWKRRRAARKFEVYMRKQNRDVQFDEEGRYVDPDQQRRNPNDRKWMN